jgi:methionine aminotransferase
MVAPVPVSRLPKVGTTIFTVMSRLAGELGAINTGQGVPDFDPPERLCDLVAQHVRGGRNQYAPMAGVLELRVAIAEKLQRLYRRTVSVESDITVTAGGTEALCSSIQALVSPGDEVVLFDPAYDSYEPVVELCGGICRRLPLTRPDFGIDWEQLAAALNHRTRLVVLNTPHNPSGALLTRGDLDRLAELLRPTAAFVLSDEVYEHMVFDGRVFESVNGHPELAERAVVVSSFGKTYHATGWKIGYCVAPAALSAEIRKVHQFNTFAVATPLQHAIADFMRECPEWEVQLPAFYQAKRDLLLQLLSSTRLIYQPTESTYFQLVDYSAVSSLSDADFSMWLLREVGVATIPVSPFCRSHAAEQRVVRLCFAKQDDTLRAAAARLASL